MIFAFGDCHAGCLWGGVPEVAPRWLMAMTMRRAAWEDERRLPAEVEKARPSRGDCVLWGWGELDVRYRLPLLAPDAAAARIAGVTFAYVRRLVELSRGRWRCGVVGLIPPVPVTPGNAAYFPVEATDALRRQYTVGVNAALAAAAGAYGVPFVDVFGEYAGPDGMLPLAAADTVQLHVRESGPARRALVAAKLLAR